MSESLTPPVDWRFHTFDALPPSDLYAALALRQLVFVVEQRCPYLDADGHDDRAWHLLGWTTAPDAPGVPLLGAYARVFAPGIKYAEASIGRIVTHPAVRRSGLGRVLVAEALRRVDAIAPGAAVRIGAQLYLERFYGEFGFQRVSDDYDEDGILHVEMLRERGPGRSTA